ncbi:selenocysteine-specific elongation factor-like [Bolinopsis microptera]|uniref:selenocysteine-specific elongation factor-like n=1 Tax=Bolinopsis microptera TaxID=2820187 RepID=UPI003078F5CE
MFTPNFNIGILGHVDSGKTTLAKALSHTASTACFDKNPQSKERGITLDLGFSSFTIPYPSHLGTDHENLLITLVDCPGHASLLKTVIGGAHIIDLMILVVDIIKGIQTQTAECLIIGELTCDKLLVVLNKTDLIPEDKRADKIAKVRKKISMTLSKTKFKNAEIISCSAAEKEGVENLISIISNSVVIGPRDFSGDFVFSVDHCFGVKGQGTVLTGTCLSGCIGLNDTVKISNTKLEKKIKSIQVFRKSVDKLYQGDRAGICVAQFDPKLIERGLVYTGSVVKTVYAVIIDINKVAYYKGSITTKMKYHVSIGHETVLAKITFFKTEEGSSEAPFNMNHNYLYQDTYSEGDRGFALLQFEHPVLCVEDSMVIISRLDMDINTPACRLAFYGRLRHIYTSQDYSDNQLSDLRIFKYKEREGQVERMNDEYTVIGKDLFKKETDIDLFSHLAVNLSTGELGKIEGSFGQSGKFKVYVQDGLSEKTKLLLASKKKKGKDNVEVGVVPEKVMINLKFKRYTFDKKKQMLQ